VQVADVAVEIVHRLAVELEDDPEHPVRARVLGTHVDDEFFGPVQGALLLDTGHIRYADHFLIPSKTAPFYSPISLRFGLV